ncbi:MAG: hypothetical protein OSB33_07410, partial [Candidatus Poseidoniales archaeon]|nr:hypothetical protein [Candidatus Poseidoniales archaeon]
PEPEPEPEPELNIVRITQLIQEDVNTDYMVLLKDAFDFDSINSAGTEDERFEKWYNHHDKFKEFIDDSKAGTPDFLNAAVWVVFDQIRKELKELGMESEPHSDSIKSSLRALKSNLTSNPNYWKLTWAQSLISIQ